MALEVNLGHLYISQQIFAKLVDLQQRVPKYLQINRLVVILTNLKVTLCTTLQTLYILQKHCDKTNIRSIGRYTYRFLLAYA